MALSQRAIFTIVVLLVLVLLMANVMASRNREVVGGGDGGGDGRGDGSSILDYVVRT